MVAAALIVLVHLGRVDSLIALVIIGRESPSRPCGSGWPGRRLRQRRGGLRGQAQDGGPDVGDPAAADRVAPVLGVDSLKLGTLLIYVAAVLTLWSMGYYMRCAWPELQKRRMINF